MGAIIMIVYEATKQLFIEDVVQDRIEENIDRKFYEKMGYHTSQNERKETTKKLLTNDSEEKTTKKKPVKKQKIGRNDPCPCGSGKKYKQCHGK